MIASCDEVTVVYPPFSLGTSAAFAASAFLRSSSSIKDRFSEGIIVSFRLQKSFKCSRLSCHTFAITFRPSSYHRVENNSVFSINQSREIPYPWPLFPSTKLCFHGGISSTVSGSPVCRSSSEVDDGWSWTRWSSSPIDLISLRGTVANGKGTR